MEPVCSEEAIPDARVSKFLDDMMPTKLFWLKKECKDPYEREQWVFWSQEALTNWAFQECIVTALCSHHLYQPSVLIQFWAAEMIGEQRHLTTTLQPFALTDHSITNEKIIKYRKICHGFNLVVADDAEGENFMDGILGCVFRNQLPECSSDMRCYSVTEYPQLELALSCGFKSTLAMPVLSTF